MEDATASPAGKTVPTAYAPPYSLIPLTSRGRTSGTLTISFALTALSGRTTTMPDNAENIPAHLLLTLLAHRKLDKSVSREEADAKALLAIDKLTESAERSEQNG
jgi:hypothetical protein